MGALIPFSKNSPSGNSTAITIYFNLRGFEISISMPSFILLQLLSLLSGG